MSDFYSEMQKIASDVLGEFAQGKIEYVAIIPGNGPKDDPGKSSEAIFDVDGVARGVKFSYVDNSSVVASDLQITIPSNVVTPEMTGFVRIDDVPHKIQKIISKPSAGTPVTYIVIVRK